jgi:hypothetical protein
VVSLDDSISITTHWLCKRNMRENVIEPMKEQFQHKKNQQGSLIEGLKALKLAKKAQMEEAARQKTQAEAPSEAGFETGGEPLPAESTK